MGLRFFGRKEPVIGSDAPDFFISAGTVIR